VVIIVLSGDIAIATRLVVFRQVVIVGVVVKLRIIVRLLVAILVRSVADLSEVVYLDTSGQRVIQTQEDVNRRGGSREPGRRRSSTYSAGYR
jgi:hypothetical protein